MTVLAACRVGKIIYGTAKEAQMAARMIRQSSNAKADGGLRAYACVYCPGWHLGHRASKKQLRARKAVGR